MKLTRNLMEPVYAGAKQGQVWWLGAVALLLLLIGVLDRRTGTLPVHHFYYLPIILAAIRFRQAGGLLAGGAAIALYWLANPHAWRWREAEYDLMQASIFVGVGLVTAKLSADAERMRRLALTDDLTGLHNLRSFEGRYAAAISAAAAAGGAPLSLLVLDLDRLKAINDQYGHLAGAQAVQAVGVVIAEHAPPAAVACRYGGDEFVIALPGCAIAEAAQVAECLRGMVQRLAPTLAGRALPAGTLTISVGVASLPPNPGEDVLQAGERLFHRADQALYRAKAEGRNSVYCLRPLELPDLVLSHDPPAARES